MPHHTCAQHALGSEQLVQLVRHQGCGVRDTDRGSHGGNLQGRVRTLNITEPGCRPPAATIRADVNTWQHLLWRLALGATRTIHCLRFQFGCLRCDFSSLVVAGCRWECGAGALRGGLHANVGFAQRGWAQRH